MDITKFSVNYNKKINCDYFTTLRLANPYKYKVGVKHKIKLHERGVIRDYGTAEIIEVKTIRMHQLNTYICGLDMASTVDEAKTIIYTRYKNLVADVNLENFYLVLYKRVKPGDPQKSMF